MEPDTMTYIRAGSCVRTCRPMRTYVWAYATVCVARCVPTCDRWRKKTFMFSKKLFMFLKKLFMFLKKLFMFLKKLGIFSENLGIFLIKLGIFFM